MMTLRVGTQSCNCALESHDPKLVVLTGGPGAGKTAVLEIASRSLCSHVAILPEAASFILGGTFPLHASDAGRRAAQRMIYSIQREIEDLVLAERHVAVALCDRGTLDGAAYWPNGWDSYWQGLGVDPREELKRYQTVVHLEAPMPPEHQDPSPLRTTSPDEARRKDQRIAEIWGSHPRRATVSSQTDFLSKARAALEVVRTELPLCCQDHRVPQRDIENALMGPPE